MSEGDGLYERAVASAEAGNHEEALVLFERLAEGEPENAERHSDVGVVLHSMRRDDEARAALERALRIDPRHGESLWNLAEVALSQEDYHAAEALFDRMEALGILSADLINRTALAASDSGDRRAALELLIRSHDLSPGQPGIADMITVLNLGKLAVFCENNDWKFFKDIMQYASKRFLIRPYGGGGEDEARDLMEWADVAFFEWCGPLLVFASRSRKQAKIVCRLHRYEAFRPWPGQVHWENVDALVTLGNPYVMQALRARAGDIEGRTRVVVVPNGINLDDFTFTERPRGKNLACLGYLNMRKNPMLLLQCFKELVRRDDGYRLFFAGEFQDEMLEQYVTQMVRQLDLSQHVRFDGWQDDVETWLEDKHYIVSATIGEGHPVGIMEGMARGLKPVIHHYPGAEAFFPEEHLWRTADEFVNQILDAPYAPGEYRAFVEETYPLEKQIDAIGALLTGLVDATAPADAGGTGAGGVSEGLRRRVAAFCEGRGLQVGVDGGRVSDEAVVVAPAQDADVRADAGSLPFADSSFRYVFATNTLRRSDDYVYTIGEWMRVLAPGGRLALALPDLYAGPSEGRAFRPNEIAGAARVFAPCKTVYVDEERGKDFALVLEKLVDEASGRQVLVECRGDLAEVVCLEPALRAYRAAHPETRITLRTPFPELFSPHEAVWRSIAADTAEHDRAAYARSFAVTYKDSREDRRRALCERAARALDVWPLDDRASRIEPDRFEKVLLRKLDLGDGPLVAVAPGARKAFMRWEDGRFDTLCETLAACGLTLVQLGEEDDPAIASCVNLAGRTDAREAAAVLRECVLAIGVDNGYAHLAAAVDTPAIVLYGPTLPEVSLPRNNASAVRGHGACVGCAHDVEARRPRRVCARGTQECTSSITVAQVLREVRTSLERTGRAELAAALDACESVEK